MRYEKAFDWAGYFEWLVEIIHGMDDDHEDMLPVLDYLFDKRFEWINELDANRASDGKKLRRDYAEEFDQEYTYEVADEDCSVLEMLVRLAMDVEDHITGDPDDPRPWIWFWEWLHNLGIDERCSGEGFSEKYIDQQIDRWLDGKGTRRGRGTPFPLHHFAGDQRSKDIWQQCMAYINEKEAYF